MHTLFKRSHGILGFLLLGFILGRQGSLLLLLPRSASFARQIGAFSAFGDTLEQDDFSILHL